MYGITKKGFQAILEALKLLVEPRGIEPLTSALRTPRSPI